MIYSVSVKAYQYGIKIYRSDRYLVTEEITCFMKGTDTS